MLGLVPFVVFSDFGSGKYDCVIGDNVLSVAGLVVDVHRNRVLGADEFMLLYPVRQPQVAKLGKSAKQSVVVAKKATAPTATATATSKVQPLTVSWCSESGLALGDINQLRLGQWPQPQMKSVILDINYQYSGAGLVRKQQLLALTLDGQEMDLSNWDYEWERIPVECFDIGDEATMDGVPAFRKLLTEFSDIFHTEGETDGYSAGYAIQGRVATWNKAVFPKSVPPITKRSCRDRTSSGRHAGKRRHSKISEPVEFSADSR